MRGHQIADRDAVDALYTSDEAKRRFEILARQLFIRFKVLLPKRFPKRGPWTNGPPVF